jgi:hypothetical protein
MLFYKSLGKKFKNEISIFTAGTGVLEDKMESHDLGVYLERNGSLQEHRTPAMDRVDAFRLENSTPGDDTLLNNRGDAIYGCDVSDVPGGSVVLEAYLQRISLEGGSVDEVAAGCVQTLAMMSFGQRVAKRHGVSFAVKYVNIPQDEQATMRIQSAMGPSKSLSMGPYSGSYLVLSANATSKEEADAFVTGVREYELVARFVQMDGFVEALQNEIQQPLETGVAAALKVLDNTFS